MYKSNNEKKLLIEKVVKTEVPTVDTQNKKEDGENDTEKIRIDFDKLLEMNEDTIGWIRFNQNKVDYPIVQTIDNDYYLTHSFNKKKSSYGAIFMDYRNTSLNDKNVVLFGHAIKNSMFGTLSDVFKKDFFDNNSRIIEIINLNNDHYYYEIFSYYVIEKEEFYIKTFFSDETEFQDFISTIQKRSYKNFNTSVTTTDKILTLSTCNGVGQTTKRTVIHAKRIE